MIEKMIIDGRKMKEKRQAVQDAFDNLVRNGKIEEIWNEGEDEPRYRWIPNKEDLKKMMKTCVICGKEHNCREYTCSDECHELFKQKLIKEFGEYKIAVDLVTRKEHRVPIVDIIEKGLKQEDLKNYPTVEKIKVNWINLDTGNVEVKEMTFDEYKKEIGE